MIIKDIEKEIIFKIKEEGFSDFQVEYPLNPNFGDFAICLSPLFLKSSELLKKRILEINSIERVELVGIYLNIVIKKEIFLRAAIEEAGKVEKEKKRNLLVEYITPNTNKPLHIGHLRNGFLGMAISNIFEEKGYNLIKINLLNNRGVHICKSMLGYRLYGGDKTPQTEGVKGDHFVGDYYVLYGKEEEKNPSVKEEIHEMLSLWEKGDKETISLWEKMNSWVYKGFEETYSNFGFRFDKTYYESDIYNLGKEIILKGLENNIFYKGEDGEILFNLNPKEFGLTKEGEERKITLLRKDGTTLYVTQDIALAVKKSEEYDFEKSIYITGKEQDYYFKTLLSILNALNYPWAKDIYHLSYGMVNLPEGKMKSREGKIVDADNLLLEVKENARKEIVKRYGEIDDLEERVDKIALGAIKFQFLFVNHTQDIQFDPKKSISFDGATGPYCQYAYARARSIMRRGGEIGEVDYSLLKEDEEIVLGRKILLFEREIDNSANNFNPSRIANYIYELSKEFNRFYNKHSVLESKEDIKKARIALVDAVSKTLKKGLHILGIPVLEEM